MTKVMNENTLESYINNQINLMVANNYKGRMPKVVILMASDDKPSERYVSNKIKMAEKFNIEAELVKFNENVTNKDLEEIINELNNDESVDGVILQLPVYKHLDAKHLINQICPYKDVDGLTFINAGRLVQGMPSLVPCTPKGIIDLLDEYKIKLEGSQVVVIGRSVLVGKPMANLLTNRNASVTICHSKTKDIKLYTKNADIIIVAVGKQGFLKEDMVKDGAVVIDVGINRINGKLQGDVNYENVSKVAGYITPVPGGVGPMTVYELMANVLVAHNLRLKYCKKTSK